MIITRLREIELFDKKYWQQNIAIIWSCYLYKLTYSDKISNMVVWTHKKYVQNAIEKEGLLREPENSISRWGNVKNVKFYF